MSFIRFFQTSRGSKPQFKKLWNEYLAIRIKKITINDNIHNNLNSNSNDLSITDSNDSSDKVKDEGSINSGHELEEMIQEYELLSNFLDIIIIDNETIKEDIRSILKNENIHYKMILQLCNKVQLVQSDELIDIIESIYCSLLEFIETSSCVHISNTNDEIIKNRLNIDSSIESKVVEDTTPKKQQSIDKDNDNINISDLMLRSLLVLYSVFSDKSTLRSCILMSIENEKDSLIINNTLKAVTAMTQPVDSVFLFSIITRMIEVPIILLSLMKGNIINHLLSLFESIQDREVRLLIIDLIKSILHKYRICTQVEDMKPNETAIDKEANIITYKGYERTYKCTGHMLTHGRPKQSPKIQGNVNKTLAERGFSIAFNVMNELLRMTPWMPVDDGDKEVLDTDNVYNFIDMEMRAVPLDMLTSECIEVNNALHSPKGCTLGDPELNLKLINDLLIFRLECVIDLESCIESLSTIYDILFANPVMQKEFKMCLGYQKIVETLFFIEGAHKLETGDYMIVSRRLLSIMTNTVYDGETILSQGCSISNIYSLVILKGFLDSCNHYFVVMAVHMIQSLIRVNPMNVVSLEETGIITCLSEKLVAFICDKSTDKFEIELIIDIVTILQMVSVATSYRDNDVVTLFSQILVYITYSCQYHSLIQRCSNCEMENATFECIHESCISEGRVGLCFECDKVFHKSTAKRSHIRMPMVNDRVQPCLANLNNKSSKHVCFISDISVSHNHRSNKPSQELLLLVFVSALLGLLDDRVARNQELLPSLLESILLVFRKVVALPISAQNIEILKVRRLMQKIDPLNDLSDDSDPFEQINQNTEITIRRLIVLSLVKLLSRTLLPALHIPYFLEEVDTSKKHIKYSEILFIFRSFGGEALLSHLLLGNSSNLSDTTSLRFILSQSDKQLIIWLFREILVTAVEIDHTHANGMIEWLVWLLCCPSASKLYIPSKTIIPKIVSNPQSKTIDINFAIVPIAYSAVSAVTKLHLLQELQLLFAGDDNDNFINESLDNVKFASSKSKNMSIIPLNNMTKSSRQQSFELFSRDDISKTNSKDIDVSFSSATNKSNRNNNNGNNIKAQLPLLYRTPCVCPCIQEFFNSSNCIQTLLHLIFGDLCDNRILAELFSDIVRTDHQESESLNEVDVELWWQSLTLLIRLLCNNDKGKSIIDTYVSVTDLIKALLPLAESTFGAGAGSSSFLIKNELSAAILHFLVELCVCNSRIFPPTKPFVALATQTLDSMDDATKVIKADLNIMCRPTLSSLRVYTDLTEKLDESASSSNSLLNLSPIYYAEDRFLKFVNEIIRPKPLLFLPRGNGQNSTDLKSSNLISSISAIPASIHVASRKIPLIPVDSKETLGGEAGEGSTVGSQTSNLKYHKSYNSILTLNSTSSVQLGNDNDSVNAWENESQGRNSHHSLLALGHILLPFSPDTPPDGSVHEESTFKENQKGSLQVLEYHENVSMTSESGAKYSTIEKNRMNSLTSYFPLFDILDSYNETSADTLLTIISEIMSGRAGYMYKTDKKFNLLSTSTKSTTKKHISSKDSSAQSSSSSDSGPSNDFMQIALKRQLFALLPTTKERKTLINWQPNFSRIAIRSMEHAQLLISIFLVTRDDSQALAFGMLLHLVEGNPYNSDLLFSSSERAAFVVELLPFLNEKSRDSTTYLLAQIFCHHPDNVLLKRLMRGAYKLDDSKKEGNPSDVSKSNDDENKKLPDISRQLLQIIKQAAVKKSPCRYVHFDNSHPFKSRIMLPTLDKLPSSKLGITITSWLRIGCLGQCPTSSLYQIAINNGNNNIVNVIDVYFRVVYKNISKDCETTSNASGWSAFPNDMYQSDESSKRTLQLCLSFSAQRNKKGGGDAINSPYRDIAENWEAIITKLNPKPEDSTSDPGSLAYTQMGTLASAIVGNSLPDAIIDYEWTEVGDWQLFAMGLSENGLTCFINGVEKTILYWTPLGYRLMADTSGNYKNLYNPLDVKEVGMHMCVGGRFVEEKAYSEILGKIASEGDSLRGNKLGSCEEDIINIYSKLIGGFSGTLSDLVTFEGALDSSQQLTYFNLGPNSDISIFSNRRLISISPLFGRKESESVFHEESGVLLQDRAVSPQSIMSSSILTSHSKSKSKRPEPFPLTFGNNTQTSRVSDLFNIFGGSSSMLPKGDYDGKNYPEYNGTLKVYEKISLLESIDKAGGLKIIYPLLVADRSRQVEAMRIIVAMLQSSQSMFKTFFSSRQHNVLLYCLHCSTPITSVESLKELFDLLCPVTSPGMKFTSSDNIAKNHMKIYNRPQVLSLLFDVILAASKKPQIARSMMDWLREICDNISENCAFILDMSCLLPSLILLSLWSISLSDSIQGVDSQNSSQNNSFHDYNGSTERSRLQISCSKLLRILLMGTSGIYHKSVSSTINTVTPTGFSVENLSLLICFIQFTLRSALTEVDNLKATPYLKHDSDLPIPFFGTNDTQNWSLNAALSTIDGILAVSDGPLFATISNMLRSTFPKDIWFHFLDLASSIHVSIRERAMRLICICMSSPNGEIDIKQVSIFEKLYGFEVLGEHLAFYTADENIVESLIAMMFWKLGPRPYGVANNAEIEKSSSNETDSKIISDINQKFGGGEFQGDFLNSRSEDIDISAEYVVTAESELAKPGLYEKTSPIEENNSAGLLSFFNWKNTKSLLPSESNNNLDQLVTENVSLDNNIIDDSSSVGKLSREMSFVSVAMESPDKESTAKARRHSSNRVSSGTRRLLSPLSAALLGLNEDESVNSIKSPLRRKRNSNSLHLDENTTTESQQTINMNTLSSIQSQGTIVLPQAIYCLMKVLQTSQRSDIVAKSCGCLERALLMSVNGEVKVNMRNLEALTSQKDWLIWLCNCVLFFRKKIRSNVNVLNSYLHDQFSDSESIGDYRSESGMESEDSMKSRGVNDPNGSSRTNAVAEEHFTSPILDLIKTTMILAMEQKPSVAQKYLSEVFRLPVPDANEVQVDLIFDILDAIDSSSLRPTEATFNLLKNFNFFLEQIIEKLDMGIDICARVLQTIQAIGYRAPPEIRSRIKEIGLQETRNTFVCSCLIEYSGLVDRDKENYDRVALWIEVQPSLYAYLSASESKQLSDNQVIFIILGIFMECTEDFDSISQVDPQESPDIDVSVLLERLQIILTVLEALIAIIQGCASVSPECNKCLIRMFTDLAEDADNNILRAFAHNFKSLPNVNPSLLTSSSANSTNPQQLSSNKASELLREGDLESKSWWSNWTSNHQATLSNGNSLNMNPADTFDKVFEIDDARSFLDWYCSPNRRQLYKEIKKRMARDLIPILKNNEKNLEKNVQRRSKHTKSLQEKHHKDKLTMTKGMNESSNKAKVIGNAGYKDCNESMKAWMQGLNDRIEKGKTEYEAQIKNNDIAEVRQVQPEIETIKPDLLHYLQNSENTKFNDNQMRQAMFNIMEYLKH